VGLAPFASESVAVKVGKLVLREIDPGLLIAKASNLLVLKQLFS